MTINIANNDPRVSYSVSQGVTQTSFTVSFEFFAAADLNVYVDDVLKTLTADYTVSGGDGSTGSITMSVTGAAGGSTVVITRDVTQERITDFPSSGPFAIGSLNTELDKFTAMVADIQDQADRSIRLADSDTDVSMVLPVASDRADKILAFDENGAISMGTSSSLDLDLDTITLENINTPALTDLKIKSTVRIQNTGSQDRLVLQNDTTPEINATGSLTVTSTSTLTLDAEGDINMDANGGDVRMKDNGTTLFTFRMTGEPRILSHNGGLLIETDGSDPIKFKSDTNQIFMLGTGSVNRFTFNTDDTPTIVIDQDSNTLSLASDTLTAARTITFPDATGTVVLTSGGTFTGNISLGDNVETRYGDSNDLVIKHDGTNSKITNSVGNLNIESDNNLTLGTAGFGQELYFKGVANGAASLYYNNVVKLATTTNGADVTGTLDCSGDFTVNTDKFHVDESLTRVGIGTSSPQEMLHLNGGSSLDAYLKIQNSSSAADGVQLGLTSGSNVATLSNASNSDFVFKTDDATWITFDVSASKIDATKFIEAPYFQAASDINLKENIVKIESAIDKIKTISGYTYNFKDNPSVPRAGLIAQEVEEILPEVVSTSEEGKKSIDYNGTIALLVEAIKEQQEEINLLKDRLS